MPSITHQIKNVDMDEKLTSEMIKTGVIKSLNIETTMLAARMMKCLQIASGFIINEDKVIDINTHKLNDLMELIENNPEQMIVWCRFIHSIERIKAELDKRQISYDTYYGDHHGDYINFESSGKRIWLAQLQSSAGYDLSNVNLTVYYELDYSRINYVQSMGRNVRIDSRCNNKMYVYLLTPLDKIVYDVLQDKNFTAEDVEAYVKANQ
jgi:ERCC4-related helicase